MSEHNTEAMMMASEIKYLKLLKARLEAVRCGLSSDGGIWNELKELEDDIQTTVDTLTKGLIEHCSRRGKGDRNDPQCCRIFRRHL